MCIYYRYIIISESALKKGLINNLKYNYSYMNSNLLETCQLNFTPNLLAG